MNTTPVISVLVTTYNMQKYIARAIESILSQEIKVPMEIIVADDCSTDDTLNIIEEYQKKYPEKINILYAKTNKGLITNFYIGLQNCKGDFIATLDADDYWIDSYKLQKQYDLLQSHEDAAFIYTNFYFENNKTKHRSIALKQNHQPDNDNLYIDMLMNLWPQISTPLIRKSFLNFEELNEFVKLNFHCQDLPLFLNLSLKAKAIYLPHITTVYSVIQGSMSRNIDIKKRINIFHKTKTIEDYFINKFPIPNHLNIKRNFLFKQKCLLASWFSNNFEYVKSFTKNLSIKDFLQFNPKAIYIFIASKNKVLYQLFKPWVTRKRKTGN